MTPPTTESTPTFPADVIDFAAESGVTDYLVPVWEMTRRVFPTASRITAVLDHDAEIEGLRHIRFDVEIGGLTVEQYADLHWHWSGELFKACPATHVCSFGLSLEIKDA